MKKFSYINQQLEKKYEFLKANPSDKVKNRTDKFQLTDTDLDIIVDYLEFMFSHYLITNKQYKEIVTDSMKKEWHDYENFISKCHKDYFKNLPECQFVMNVFNQSILICIKQTDYEDIENYSELYYEFINCKTINR